MKFSKFKAFAVFCRLLPSCAEKYHENTQNGKRRHKTAKEGKRIRHKTAIDGKRRQMAPAQNGKRRLKAASVTAKDG
jgi:hypothetical protein